MSGRLSEPAMSESSLPGGLRVIAGPLLLPLA